MISREDVQKLATLSRIELAPDEIETVRHEFTDILDYVARIRDAVTDAESSTQSSPVEKHDMMLAPINVLREDTNPRIGGEYTDSLVKAAPNHTDTFVQVKHMF